MVSPDIFEEVVTFNKPVSYSVFTCSFCDLKFSQQLMFIEHLKNHIEFTTETTQNDIEIGYQIIFCSPKFLCLFCGKLFASSSDVGNHLKVHEENSIYSCLHCDRVFSHKCVFDHHMRSVHEASGSQKFHCNFCNNSFPCLQSFSAHQKVCKAKSFCKASVKKTKSRKARNNKVLPRLIPLDASEVPEPSEHIVIDGQAETEAPDAENFQHALNPRSHKITKTSFGRIYIPDTSSNNVVSLQDFDPPSDLENLKGYMIKGVEDGRQKYICLACGKNYTTEYNIKKHRQLHLGEGLHVCSLCGYSTGHKHAYDAHMRLHSGEKPYKCDGCGKSFSDRSNFRAHKKRCIKPMFAV